MAVLATHNTTGGAVGDTTASRPGFHLGAIIDATKGIYRWDRDAITTDKSGRVAQAGEVYSALDPFALRIPATGTHVDSTGAALVNGELGLFKPAADLTIPTDLATVDFSDLEYVGLPGDAASTTYGFTDTKISLLANKTGVASGSPWTNVAGTFTSLGGYYDIDVKGFTTLQMAQAGDDSPSGGRLTLYNSAGTAISFLEAGKQSEAYNDGSRNNDIAAGPTGYLHRGDLPAGEYTISYTAPDPVQAGERHVNNYQGEAILRRYEGPLSPSVLAERVQNHGAITGAFSDASLTAFFTGKTAKPGDIAEISGFRYRMIEGATDPKLAASWALDSDPRTVTNHGVVTGTFNDASLAAAFATTSAKSGDIVTITGSRYRMVEGATDPKLAASWRLDSGDFITTAVTHSDGTTIDPTRLNIYPNNTTVSLAGKVETDQILHIAARSGESFKIGSNTYTNPEANPQPFMFVVSNGTTGAVTQHGNIEQTEVKATTVTRANAGVWVACGSVRLSMSTSGNRSFRIRSASGSINVRWVTWVAWTNTEYNGGDNRTTADQITLTESSSTYLAPSYNMTSHGNMQSGRIYDFTNDRYYMFECFVGYAHDNNVYFIKEL